MTESTEQQEFEKIIKKYFKDYFDLNRDRRVAATFTREVLHINQTDKALENAIKNNSWDEPSIAHEATHKVGANRFTLFAGNKNKAVDEKGQTVQNQDTPKGGPKGPTS